MTGWPFTEVNEMDHEPKNTSTIPFLTSCGGILVSSQKFYVLFFIRVKPLPNTLWMYFQHNLASMVYEGLS